MGVDMGVTMSRTPMSKTPRSGSEKWQQSLPLICIWRLTVCAKSVDCSLLLDVYSLILLPCRGCLLRLAKPASSFAVYSKPASSMVTDQMDTLSSQAAGARPSKHKSHSITAFLSVCLQFLYSLPPWPNQCYPKAVQVIATV